MTSKDKTPKPPRGGKKPRVEPTIGKTDTPPEGTPPNTDTSAEVKVTVEASAGKQPAKPRVRVKSGETADEAVKRERRKVLFSKSDVKSLGDASEEIVTRGGRPIFWGLLILVAVFFLCWMLRDVGASWLSRQAPAATTPSVTVNPPSVTVTPPDVNVTVNNPPPAAPPPVVTPKPKPQPPRPTPPPATTPPQSTIPPAVGESLRPPGMITPPGEQGVTLPPSAQEQVKKTDCLILKPFPRQFPNDVVRFDFKNRQMCYVTSANNRYHPPTGCVPYAQMTVVQKRLYDQYAAVYAK